MTAPASSPAPPGTATSASATCVFAVCPRAAEGALAAALASVPGHVTATGPVRALAAGPLTAVVQDVPAEAFTPEALRERLADRAALEQYARAHDEVVAVTAATAPAVPLPLATLYLADGRAADALVADAARLLTVLDRVTGREEWGVKLTLTGRATAPPPEPAAAPAPAPTPAPEPSGRAYLDRVRGRQRAREDRQRAAYDAAERVDARLRPLATAARRLRLQGDGAQGGPQPQVFNAAYLVDRARAAEFRAAVAALRQAPEIAERLRIDLTGPWAPYSFTGEDHDDTHG
ncbi:GvpL/GvpF family gas vesicle protein [Streptomyces avicenniae]|uniref:GvpL/GvpF family gas vesicle protein n=1 Tax=Streptomyces avicenniae TaxID=500153 RepID=UPI00069A5524|nr:GvpL/GvpF family gas vesicle protein [Streptomyces avicenniae]